MRYGTIFLFYTLLLFTACHKKPARPQAVVMVEEPREQAAQTSTEGNIYRPSATRFHDLLHTRLDLRFNYGKKEIYGVATLQLKPYFYPSDEVTLDAKNFEFTEVRLVKADGSKDSVYYTYDGRHLRIRLNRKYRNNETYSLRLVYTAFPERNGAKGSAAITDSKGLYFINSDGSEPDKPRQIWTQGETEYASCWFPTIDVPNEKMTQEIYLTVNEKDVTLSNGELMYSTFNKDGTRTDCWKQDQPHAPYLAMIAVGPFSIIKETWRDTVEVSYYLEPAYRPYAKLIFGNTPEMLEFYSKKLGVNYPWKKFAQVVVRDFVSGAMENTSAVVHGEFLQHDAREHLDDPHEDVIAHELFHHWFGDLVTCESWANLPLNESFATYGEYLWEEHKYGRDDADFHLWLDYQQYIGESMKEKKRMIRFYHQDPNDMFDNHSYQKGGLILHMLRNYVGDDAFFKSLQLYLTRYRFSTAEMHQLRLCFEEVTGEDLNWFFNQWFFGKGHPDVETFYTWIPERNEIEFTALQRLYNQDSTIFRLPLDIDFHVNGKITRERIWLEEPRTTYRFSMTSKPEAVVADPERILLTTHNDFREDAEWWYTLQHSKSVVVRTEAFRKLTLDWQGDSLQWLAVKSGLHDSFWFNRVDALDVLGATGKLKIKPFREQLIQLALHDRHPAVRSAAFQALRKIATPDMFPAVLAGTNDSAYSVAGAALLVLNDLSIDTALLIARLNKSARSPYIRPVVAELLAKNSQQDEQAFFEEVYRKGDVSSFFYYSYYLLRQKGDQLEKGVRFLEKAGEELKEVNLMRMVVAGNVYQLQERMDKEVQEYRSALEKTKPGEAAYILTQEKLRVAEEYKKRLMNIKVE